MEASSTTTISSLLPNFTCPSAAAVSVHLSLSQPTKRPASHPLYSPTHPRISLDFKEKILCLEDMGVDTGRAVSLNPSLRNAPLSSINDVVSFLRSKGIHHKELPRILGMCPWYSPPTSRPSLSPCSHSSRGSSTSPRNYHKPVVKYPRLLTSSVRDLNPALFFLLRLRDKHALAYQDPVLLVSSMERTLIPKLRFLEGIGLSRDEVVGMMQRCPWLFTFSIENNFRPKYDYFR